MFFKLFTTDPAFWDEAFANPAHKLCGKMPDDNFSQLLMNCEIFPWQHKINN